MTTYEFTADYKTDMHRHIDALFADKMSTRQQRLDSSDALIESYVVHADERPDGSALERLGTLLLLDELTDDTPWKTRNTEYPIESERQELDYYNGLSLRKVPETIGTDGEDYRLPTRKYY